MYALIKYVPQFLDGGIRTDVSILDRFPVDIGAGPFEIFNTQRLTVADDYISGEILPDQPGANNVLTFTFTNPVVSFWVGVTGTTGICKVNHYGPDPDANNGIPVEAGEKFPIPEPASVVKVYAPTGVTVTVWGHTRA